MSRAHWLGLWPLFVSSTLVAQSHDPAAHRGHDMAAMPETAPRDAVGTDLTPGRVPPPPVATDRAADRFFDPQTMARAQAEMFGAHGGMTMHKIVFNLAEVRARDDGYRWDAHGWFGGDIDRLAVKFEGEGRFGAPVEHGEVQALWSHAIDPYWSLQTGVRHDFGEGPDQSFVAIGIEGLAPYWIDLAASAYVSSHGELRARLEADVDQRITQKLIVQPRLEANFAAQKSARHGIGAGLSTLELGLRLRYEIAKTFAPYVGVSHDRKIGQTAKFARAAGEEARETSLVAGVRFWF